MTALSLARPAFLAPLLVTAACSTQGPAPASPASPVSPSEARVDETPALVGVTGEKPERSQRRVGDLWVQRFSGSFRAESLILEEEVLAREGDVFVVEYRLREGDQTEVLRVRVSVRSDRVVAVSRVTDGEESPADIEALDGLLAKTSFSPDRNTGQLASQRQTCLIGPDEYQCQLEEFGLVVNDEPATLAVERTQELGRDVSGEVTAVDGTILYRAEIVEVRQGSDDVSDESVAWAE